MKTSRMIMMIIIKTKIAGLKIIISQKNQKITMTFNKTSFTKAAINSNQLSWIITMIMKLIIRGDTRILKRKNIIKTRVIVMIINIITKDLRSKVEIRADM